VAVLPIDPHAPLLIRAGAAALLYGHIGGGSLGIAAGVVAMAARKGGWWHRKAGTVFFGSMLVMAGIGATVAPFLNDPVSSIAGMLTFYLVLTGWMTVRRRAPGVGAFEYAGLAVVLGIGAADAALYLAALNTPEHTLAGVPPQAFFVIGLIVALAAAMDVRVIARGGIEGPQRTARHLWRMCTALTIAAGSAFLGQPKVQAVVPKMLHGFWLFVPELAVLVLMAYWLVRLRVADRRRRGSAAFA
jgi:hypothetical protein